LSDPLKPSYAGAAEAVATIGGGSNAGTAALLPLGEWVAFRFGRRAAAAEVVPGLVFGQQRRR